MKSLYLKFRSAVYFLSICSLNCSAQYFERIFGDSLHARGSFLSVDQTQNIWVTGVSDNNSTMISGYYAGKITSSGQLIWERNYSDGLNSFASSVVNLQNGITAISGTHNSSLYNSLTEVLYVDSAGSIVNRNVYPPLDGWGTSSVAMTRLSDSAVAVESYIDGFISTNFYSVIGLNTDLSSAWSDFAGFDGSIANNHSLTSSPGINLYSLSYYPDFFYSSDPIPQVSEIIKRDITGLLISDSLYQFFCATNCIKATSDGGAIICGTQDSTVKKEIVLIKIDSIGNVSWHHQFYANLNTESNSVVETADGGYAVLSTVDDSFLPDQHDVLLSKYNSEGDSLWSRQFGFTLDEHAIHLERNGSDLFILAETNSFAEDKICVIKTDSSGSIPSAYSIISSGRYFCKGDSTLLQINPLPSQGDHVRWSTGDTTNSILVRNTGNYSATVNDSAGILYETSIVPVYFTNHPDAFFAMDTVELCQGQMLYDSSLKELTNNYQWYRNGVSLPNEIFPSFIPQSTGNYQLIVSNICGSDTSSSFVKSLFSLPAIPVITSPAILYVCEGDSLKLTATGTDTDSLQWYTVNTSSLFSIQGAVDSEYYATTDETFVVESVNSNGCSIFSDSRDVHFDHTSETVGANGPVSFCSGGEVDLTVSPGNNYTWSNGDSLQTITINSSGDYSVSFINVFGCEKNSDTIHINVRATPNVFIGGDTTVCNGTSITFDAGNNFENYLWSDHSTSQTLMITPNVQSSANLPVYVFVTDSNGCTNSDTLNLLEDICTSIIEYAQNSFIIYPNPVEKGQNISVINNNLNNSILTVMDITGKIIGSKKLDRRNNDLNEIDLSKGVYLFCFLNDNNLFQKIVVVN